MKFTGMVFSAARAWLQVMTPAAATKTTRNMMGVLLKISLDRQKNPAQYSFI
jgi:hypothetical protein